MTASAFTFCEQIGRLWAANSALGLTFAEPRSAVPANIYADRMPTRVRRLTPGVSLTPEVAAPSEPMSPTHAIGVAVEVRAENRRSAMAVLEELHRILWPDDRPYSPQSGTVHGQSAIGVFGPPPATPEGSVTLWRVIELQPVQIPTIIEGANLGKGEEGLEIATMTMRALAVRQAFNTPTVAFRVWADSDTWSAATIAVTGSAVTVTLTNGEGPEGTVLLFTAHATIALMRAAIAALDGVSVEVVNADEDATASSELVAMAATNILGRENATDLVVGV